MKEQNEEGNRVEKLLALSEYSNQNRNSEDYSQFYIGKRAQRLPINQFAVKGPMFCETKKILDSMNATALRKVTAAKNICEESLPAAKYKIAIKPDETSRNNKNNGAKLTENSVMLFRNICSGVKKHTGSTKAETIAIARQSTRLIIRVCPASCNGASSSAPEVIPSLLSAYLLRRTLDSRLYSLGMTPHFQFEIVEATLD